MKMKSYKVTFFRHNPQFKNGGYVTERKIEAVSLPFRTTAMCIRLNRRFF